MDALSLLVALGALGIACLALFRPFLDVRKLRSAFRLIEDEWEDTREHIATALGRASRLKRSIMESAHTQPEPGDVESPPIGEDSAQPASGIRLTPRQTAIQARIIARRHG